MFRLGPFLYAGHSVFPLAVPSSLDLQGVLHDGFVMVLCPVMWPNQESFRRFTVDNKGS